MQLRANDCRTALVRYCFRQSAKEVQAFSSRFRTRPGPRTAIFRTTDGDELGASLKWATGIDIKTCRAPPPPSLFD